MEVDVPPQVSRNPVMVNGLLIGISDGHNFTGNDFLCFLAVFTERKLLDSDVCLICF
jgi:hypothetical protein